MKKMYATLCGCGAAYLVTMDPTKLTVCPRCWHPDPEEEDWIHRADPDKVVLRGVTWIRIKTDD